MGRELIIERETYRSGDEKTETIVYPLDEMDYVAMGGEGYTVHVSNYTGRVVAGWFNVDSFKVVDTDG